MKQISLAMLGFGNVGKAFVRLLQSKQATLRDDFQLEVLVTGIKTAHHGTAIDSAGLNLERALETVENGQNLSIISESPLSSDSVEDFLYNCSSQFLVESTSLNPFDGQPALSYLETAIISGKHVITANKGPLVYGYTRLTKLAKDRGKAFYFESTVMDGAPIFSLFRETLPAIELKSVKGILNSCTNYLLDLQRTGMAFEDSVLEAQRIGITETNADFDIDGWDAAIKLAAISTVLFDIPLNPTQVDRKGIRSITAEMIKDAESDGEKWKLVCSAARKGKSLLYAKVQPERVAATSSLFNINGTSSYVQFETDMLPALGITETDPGPETTAYGMLSDLLTICRDYLI
ncbi:MAG: homoserine dehydrogenase [Chloroflexi bacterium 44-23]|nr:MAG: homoserine dehydrogenase [Chloroflexi bacterium 44-23]